MRELKTTELSQCRNDILKEQGFKCRICGKPLTCEESVLDHQHATKPEELGVQGAGLVRGVLCSNCNCFEGKIWNNSRRFISIDPQDIVGSRIKFLESLIQYYTENYQKKEKIIHCTERRFETLKKSDYNKIFKAFKLDSKNYKKNGDLKPFPPYNSKMTKTLKTLKDKYLTPQEPQES